MDIREIKDKGLRDLALKRKEEQNGCSFDLHVDYCFMWWKTSEGYGFWNGVNIGAIKKLEMDRKEMTLEETNNLLREVVGEFLEELIQKNTDYNNSLHRPNIFGQDPIEGIKARISDKLNRVIAKGLDDKTEDSLKDLCGYYFNFVLMKRK